MNLFKRFVRLVFNGMVLGISFCFCAIISEGMEVRSAAGLLIAGLVIPVSITVGVHMLINKITKVINK